MDKEIDSLFLYTLTMTDEFKALGLSEPLLKAIHELNFKEPSDIQRQTIPLALAGKDIMGGSATGSGKTLAFGASIIENAEKGKGVQALILTPTRELAEQVSQALAHFSKYRHLHVTAVYGGVGMGPQVDALESAEIVVGTPGRILDHLGRGTLNISKIKTLVLDEADRMLDMGFVEDVETIIKASPVERQTLLFSATISQDIMHIAKRYMKDPVEVAVESYVDASKLEQIYYDVPNNVKFSLLVHLLKGEKAGLVMVFCNTRTNTDFVARNLKYSNIHALAIHGGLTQQKRNAIMEQFHAEEVYVLVCTDVAARGLDIPHVSHVYNYDLPKNSKEYIHRIGRTARAGREGKAISLVSQRDYENFRRVLEDSSLKIKPEDVPQVERAPMKIFERSGGRFGDRDERSGGRGGYGGGRGYGSRGRGGGGGGGGRGRRY
ncbi:DEAD/DEAH box helicase [Candidatus Pacearchaeota archaeon]|nr:DEAD/DEAH box helicase [Candidatus Pacearchaeota archaeon]